MLIPSLRDHMVAHVGIMLIKVTKFGYTTKNHISFLKAYRLFLNNLFFAYIGIIAIYEISS